ncbi:MAG: hypothetical protein FJX75_08590 [Armatimonadetes bacterium]|nr:hypothetical protein [Armatimonadota bacterium]
MRELYKNVLLVDSGNAGNRADVLRIMYQSMVLMGYDAAGVGILEAGMGTSADQAAKETGLPLVGTVGPGSGETAPGRSSRKVGEVTVGVVSAGWVADPKAKEYRDTLRGLLEAARAESDFVVLLSQLGRLADRELASVEGFVGLADVIVGNSDALQGTKPEPVGQTLLLPTSRRGRELGVLEVKLSGNQAEYHDEVILLAKDLPEDARIAEIVSKYYADRQERSGEGRPVGGVEAADGPDLPDIYSAEEQKAMRARGYLTADECGRCHQEQLTQWQSTPHSQALKTLVDRQRVVQECLVCHSEANRRGLAYEAEGADRFGVDCAACHGAGLFHASMKGAKDTIVRTPGETLCRRCHTPDQDAEFKLDVRLEKVRH